MDMKRYRITIAEDISFKQFTIDLSSGSETEAKQEAKRLFIKEYPIYSAHFKVIMCNLVLQ